MAQPNLEPFSMVFIIFIGTFVMSLGLMILLVCSYIILGNDEVLPSFLFGLIGFIYLIGVGLLIHFRHHVFAAWSLVVFYGSLATIMLAMWSVNVPAGILMMAFTIILAGVLLGARRIIPVTVIVTGILAVLQFATMIGWIHPDLSDLANAPNFGDVAGYGTIFIVFAIVMWLSRLRLEQALRRALAAEQALEREKQSLAIRLEEKTRHLKESQLEEMRQLYRFSELGQSSTALLHELANHLAVITLDIDAIDKRQQHSGEITRVKESIGYLDGKIKQLRRQLKQSAAPQRFAVYPLLREVTTQLRHKSEAANVELKIRVYGQTRYIKGDPQKLFQAITILVTNAIEAYNANSTKRKVIMTIDRREKLLKVTITDFGSGIPLGQRRRLFKPFTSTKNSGMGIGLFIAKQIIEVHMGGTLRLDPRRDQTTFVILLPDAP